MDLANDVLADCETRERMKKTVTAMYNYPRYGCPHKRGDCYFYSYNSGLLAQSVLYMQVLAPLALPCFQNLLVISYHLPHPVQFVRPHEG